MTVPNIPTNPSPTYRQGNLLQGQSVGLTTQYVMLSSGTTDIVLNPYCQLLQISASSQAMFTISNGSYYGQRLIIECPDDVNTGDASPATLIPTGSNMNLNTTPVISPGVEYQMWWNGTQWCSMDSSSTLIAIRNFSQAELLALSSVGLYALVHRAPVGCSIIPHSIELFHSVAAGATAYTVVPDGSDDWYFDIFSAKPGGTATTPSLIFFLSDTITGTTTTSYFNNFSCYNIGTSGASVPRLIGPTAANNANNAILIGLNPTASITGGSVGNTISFKIKYTIDQLVT